MAENPEARQIFTRREALKNIAASCFAITRGAKVVRWTAQSESQLRIESLPSEILDLNPWKLTLPTGLPGKPTEIKQPALAGYQNPQWFFVNEERDGVRFRAPINGVTTSGSNYPRSELREMTGDGRGNASWSSTEGTHTLFLDQAITAVPQTKSEVVAGQIHDAKDDILVVRLEGPNLYINVDSKNTLLLNPNYTLGERFTVQFVVGSGKTQVYYNKNVDPVFTLDKNYSGAYFKAGAYPQSNCNKEGPALCNEENFGEVIIYKALVLHEWVILLS